MLWFFGCKACEILALWLEIKSTSPALEGKVLTPGPPETCLKPVLTIEKGKDGSHAPSGQWGPCSASLPLQWCGRHVVGVLKAQTNNQSNNIHQYYSASLPLIHCCPFLLCRHCWDHKPCPSMSLHYLSRKWNRAVPYGPSPHVFHLPFVCGTTLAKE